MATTNTIVINNKSGKADIIKWAKETNHIDWLKAKAKETVTRKVYPKVLGADGKMVDDKSQPCQYVEKPQSFLGIKKAIIAEFFTDKSKKKKSFLDEIEAL